jgi:hypothetical protein
VIASTIIISTGAVVALLVVVFLVLWFNKHR